MYYSFHFLLSSLVMQVNIKRQCILAMQVLFRLQCMSTVIHVPSTSPSTEQIQSYI